MARAIAGDLTYLTALSLAALLPGQSLPRRLESQSHRYGPEPELPPPGGSRHGDQIFSGATPAPAHGIMWEIPPQRAGDTGDLAGYTEVLDPALVLAFHTQGQVIYWRFRDYEVPGRRNWAGDSPGSVATSWTTPPLEILLCRVQGLVHSGIPAAGVHHRGGGRGKSLPLEQFDEGTAGAWASW